MHIDVNIIRVHFRISRFCNVSFFIAPTPVLDFSDIRINITLPDNCKENPEFQPGLIYWDTGSVLIKTSFKHQSF